MEKQKKQAKKPKFYKAATGEFDESNMEQVRFLAGIGLTVKKISAYFGMSKSTFERRCAIQPEIYDALEKGRAQADAKVMKTAFDLATSGKCPIMTMFWLKTRCGWKEGIEVELNHKIDGAVGVENEVMAAISNMTKEEVAERIKILEMELLASGRYSMKEQV